MFIRLTLIKRFNQEAMKIATVKTTVKAPPTKKGPPMKDMEVSPMKKGAKKPSGGSIKVSKSKY